MSDKIASIELVRLGVAEIRPHPRNPRRHPKPGSVEWTILQRSLARDYFDPIVVNRRNGLLVSGHLRFAILCDMGYSQVDVSVVDYDEEEHLARMIAANTLIGEFEAEILSSLAKDIEAAGLDPALAGFDEAELMALVEVPKTEDDSEHTGELLSKADVLQADWQVKLGDMFQVGEHRLFCGDCGQQDSWTQLLEGRPADMMWTDPPYNIDYEAIQERRIELNKQRGGASTVVAQGILNDDVSPDEYAALLKEWFKTGFNNVRPGGAFYIAHADMWRVENELAAKEAGWRPAQNLIWVKSGATLGRQDHNWQHEPVLYGWKPGGAHRWFGGFKQTTIFDSEPDLKKMSKAELIVLVNQMRNERETSVIREPRNIDASLHPTIKPVALVARQVWNSSLRGETVLELFGGSGTTMAACQQIGRKCVATELAPKYCAVILERMKAYGVEIRRINGN